MKKIILFLALITISLVSKAQFKSLQDISQSLRPTILSVGDINNDNQQDLIVEQSGKLIWMENQAGIFTNHTIIIQDSFPTYEGHILAIETGDFDNNGFMDIIYSDGDGSGIVSHNHLTILYNQNGSAFTKVVLDSISPKTIEIADIDSDGDLDVITSYVNVMYINDGSANFSKINFFKFGPNYITGRNRIVNLDGDSLLDLIVLERYPYTGGYEGFIVYLDVAINQMGYQVGNIGSITSFAVKDINNDSKSDIVFVQNYKLCSLKNIDSLNWASMDTLHQFPINTTMPANNLWIEDFRNDGVNEIIYFQGKLKQLIFNGSTYDEFELDSTLNYSDLYPNFVDMNGDGFLDIISVGGTKVYGITYQGYDKNHISILESLPGNIFNRNIVYNTDADVPSAVISVDMDNDGDKDISVTLLDKQVYFENLGLNNFSSNQIELFNGQFTDVFASDFNADNYIDFIARNQAPDSLNVIYFENIGNNTFNKTIIAFQDTLQSFTLHYVDYDTDGDIDICMSSGYNFYMIPNLGGGIFGNKFLIHNRAALYFDIKFADFTGNGYPDLIYTYGYISDRKVAYVPNNAGTFGNEIILPTLLYGNSTQNLKINAIKDYDNDGDLDLFVNDYDEVLWILNDIGYPSINIDTINDINIEVALDIDNDSDLDYIFQDPSSPYYRLTINENGIYNNIPLTQNELFSSPLRKLYFGDFNNTLKDLVSYGSYDFVGFMTNKTNQIGKAEGYSFYDQNQNKLIDSNEIGLPWVQTTIAPQSLYSFSDSNGYFSFLLDSGVYQLNINNNSLWNLTTDSSSYNLNFGTTLNYDSLNFGFYPDTIQTTIESELTGAFPRCNDTVNYWLNIRNKGTTTPNGIVHLQLDDSISYVSSVIAPDSIIGQNIYWHFDSLFFYAEENFNLQAQMPPFTSMGDTLISILTVHEIDGSNNIVYTNTDTLNQVSVCAYDPNDKTVLPKGIGSQGFIANNQVLEYLIRFQNTGNDTSLTIMVRDQLDDNLDWGSLKPLASSHPMQVWIEQDGEAVFKFNNIMLPDSNVDFLGSQGFVKFSINQNPNLSPNTPISNIGHIYFDYNPAVITNTVLNTIYDCNIAPINITNSTICFGEQIEASCPEGGINNYTWNINSFYTSSVDTLNWVADTVGTFNLTLTTSNTICLKDTIISITVQLCTGIDNISNDFGILIYPNPNTGLFTIEKPKGLNKDIGVKLLDITSKLIIDKVIPIGQQKIDIDITKYSKGIYYLQLIIDKETFVKQVLKN